MNQGRGLPTWVPFLLAVIALEGPLISVAASVIAWAGHFFNYMPGGMPSWLVMWKVLGIVLGPILAIITMVTWRANSLAPHNDEDPTAWLSYEMATMSRALVIFELLVILIIAGLGAFALGYFA